VINASGEFRKGRPKNELTQEGIQKVVTGFCEWKDREGFCRVVSSADIAAADYNLSPSRFVRAVATAETGDIQTILKEIAKLKSKSVVLDDGLAAVFGKLGYRWGDQ
jgi:type I restriction enzyme M protein